MQQHFLYKLSLAVFVSIFGLLFMQCGDGKKLDVQLKIAEKVVNDKVPKQISPDLRIDSCRATVADKTLTYYYTLTLDEYGINKTLNSISPIKAEFAEAVRISPDLEGLRANDVVFKYIYKDISGKEITTIHITPNDYK